MPRATSPTVPRYVISILSPEVSYRHHSAFQVYIASRDIKACEATAQRLNKQGPGKCIALAADLSKYEDIVKLVGELSKREESESQGRALVALVALVCPFADSGSSQP